MRNFHYFLNFFKLCNYGVSVIGDSIMKFNNLISSVNIILKRIIIYVRRVRLCIFQLCHSLKGRVNTRTHQGYKTNSVTIGPLYTYDPRQKNPSKNNVSHCLRCLHKQLQSDN